ncbi:HAD family hydrolase [Candidatus Electrothrix sp.]
MRYRVVVFDYDGTLVMSNDIKRDAYFRAIPEYGNILDTVLRMNPGDTRREIIRKVLLSIDPDWAMGEELSSRIEEVAERYDIIATKGASECPERSGATACLKRLSEHVPLYLLSATQQDSLERIVDYREWRSFFQRVVGVTVSEKAGMLKSFAVEQYVHMDDILMVGDSDFDRDAACSAGAAYFHMASGNTMQDLIRFLNS